jgi:O-antigen ligase
MHAHSGFLLIYYQFGLIGLALYLSLWIVLFARAINITNPTARSLSVAALCAICILETIEIVFIQTHPGVGIALAILATTEFTSKSRQTPDAQATTQRTKGRERCAEP